MELNRPGRMIVGSLLLIALLVIVWFGIIAHTHWWRDKLAYWDEVNNMAETT